VKGKEANFGKIKSVRRRAEFKKKAILEGSAVDDFWQRNLRSRSIERMNYFLLLFLTF